MNEKEKKRLFQEFFIRVVNKFTENEKKIYLILGLLLILSIILVWLDLLNLKKIMAFGLFVLIAVPFKYVISKYKLYVEFTPIVFFCVLIGHYLGLFWVIIYILLADIMVEFYAKTGPTGGSVPWWIWMLIISLISKPFDLLGIGMYIIPLTYFIGSILIDQYLRGGVNPWRLSSAVANLIINMYFFIKFSEFFIGLVM